MLYTSGVSQDLISRSRYRASIRHLPKKNSQGSVYSKPHLREMTNICHPLSSTLQLDLTPADKHMPEISDLSFEMGRWDYHEYEHGVQVECRCKGTQRWAPS